jgi:hypothetical protein
MARDVFGTQHRGMPAARKMLADRVAGLAAGAVAP